MSAPPRRVGLNQLSSRFAPGPAAAQPVAQRTRGPLLPAGVARENQTRIQDLESRLSFLESVPTLPATVTQTLSTISGTVASVRQAVEANIETLATLDANVNATQRDLNSFRGSIDTRIDGRVDSRLIGVNADLAAITAPNGPVDQAINTRFTNFTQTNGPLDAQIDGKLSGFTSSPKFTQDVRGSLSSELASISSLNTSVPTIQGKIQNRDTTRFKTGTTGIKGDFDTQASNIASRVAQVQGVDSLFASRLSSIQSRRSNVQKAVNGGFGLATNTFGITDAEVIADEFLRLSDQVQGLIGNIRGLASIFQGGLTNTKDALSNSAAKFTTLGTNV